MKYLHGPTAFAAETACVLRAAGIATSAPADFSFQKSVQGDMTRRIRILAVLGCIMLGAASAQAQVYPSKPITIVVPFGPGGATDVIAQAVAQRLSQGWGRSIVIENKAGASTQIGAAFVARSAPDGYTLLAGPDGTFVINPYLYPKLPYDPDKDFAPVSGLGFINQARTNAGAAKKGS